MTNEIFQNNHLKWAEAVPYDRPSGVAHPVSKLQQSEEYYKACSTLSIFFARHNQLSR